jgi:cysteinyl-tRNA synthetase
VPYRQPLNYKEDLITQAQTDLEKMMRPYLGLKRKLQLEFNQTAIAKQLTHPEYLALHQEFVEAMSDDFNTANAITILFKVAKVMNGLLRTSLEQPLLIEEALFLFEQMTTVLGILKRLKPH